jgi:flagellar basal-body rod protein FlgB
MPISNIPILSMLRTRMQRHQERQRLLAENVANADTPNYRAHDLAPPDFDRVLRSAAISLARTETGHIARLGVPARHSPRMPIATMKCARAATP